MDRKKAAALMLATCFAALLIGWHFLSTVALTSLSKDYSVSDAGLLEYRIALPSYNITPGNLEENSSFSEVSFESRGAEIAAILRMPGPEIKKKIKTQNISGIVLLPGATVTKEAEQGLARRLADLGYASITLDQRNLGGIDPQGDLQHFLQGQEPEEHKMVYDALAAAMILRDRPEIDRDRIIYAGESNGGRSAIIACALDKKARGVLAISTCGYGTAAAIASATGAIDSDSARFYLSIDPESYLGEVSPRPL
ncbi:MAG TPA: acetylxylan esterase, partial [Methanothrix sp.]|nr:acetylxylan esterase [Methanothrix sp.]